MKKSVFNRTVSIILFFVLVCQICLPAIAAVRNGDNSTSDDSVMGFESEEIRLNDSQDIAYLSIKLTKNSKEYYASSLSTSCPTVNVLEHTQWQMSARFVVIRDGKIIKDSNVTQSCLWSSKDTTGSRLTVNSSGRVTAKKASSSSIAVVAAYSAFVNDEYQSFAVKMNFKVKKLSVSSDTEAVRCLAFNHLVKYRWENITGYTDGNTLSEIAEFFWIRNFKNYISIRSDQYATFNHLISGAAGNYKLVACLEGEKYLNAAVFQNGTQKYICFSFKAGDEYYFTDAHVVLYEEAENLYRMAAGSGNDIIATGIGLGGSVSKYLSYVKGCRAVTFNAESSLSYVSLYRFDDFALNYDPDLQICYNYNDVVYDDIMYNREKTWRVKRSTGNNSFSIAQMLRYNADTEAVSIVKTASKSSRPEVQTVWAKNFYLGSSAGDDPTLGPVVSHDYDSWVMLGGKQDDKLVMTESLAAGQSYENVTAFTSLLANAIPGNAMYSAAKLTFEAGLQLHSGESFGEVLEDKSLDLAGFIPGLTGELASAVSYAQLFQDLGMFLAKGCYPGCNIFVGGKGDDVAEGSPETDWYYYVPGDGHDTVVDGKGGCIDFLYLAGVDRNRVTCSTDPDNENLLLIQVDGEPAVDFYMENGGVEIFYDSPFKKNQQQGDIFTANQLKILYDAINSGNVRQGAEAACPVDMLILDGDGNTVAELPDGEETSFENTYGAFAVSRIEGEYVKTAVLYNADCKVALRAVDDGTMQYTAFRCDEEGRMDQSCSIRDIPVKKGDMFYAGQDMNQEILQKQDKDGNDTGAVTYDTVVDLKEEDIELSSGEQKKLTLDYSTNSTYQEYFWLSADKSVATISEDGTVLAVGEGETTVAVLALDGSRVWDTCHVTVTRDLIDAQEFTIRGLRSSYIYTGTIVDASFDVSCRGIALTEGKDYTVDFPEAIETGDYTAVVNGTGRYTGTKAISFQIREPAEASTVNEKVQQIMEECEEAAPGGEYEIAVWLHDWLTNHADYDYTYTNYEADGVLLKNTGVCNSYALAYHSLLDAAGIENRYVAAPEMNHAWNMVKLDGEWCHVDCTWDDPGTGGAENHDYFGMSDDMIAADHEWSNASYPSSTSRNNYYPLRMGHNNPVENEEELFAFLENATQMQEPQVECIYVGSDSDFDLFAGTINWMNRFNWKYGVESFQMEGSGRSIQVSMEYTDPWEQPAEFTGVAPSPLFILRGPEGTYDLNDYMDNGMILIFGREGCGNTSALLRSLNNRTADLRAAGVEVFMNLEDAFSQDDFKETQKLYPNFVYTYYDVALFSEMLEATQPNGSGWITFPCVFFINKNGMITYSSQGYVSDVDGFIQEAMGISTNTPLPDPGASDPNYYGAFFKYTGNDQALREAVADMISRKRRLMYLRDDTYTGTPEGWENVKKTNLQEKLEEITSDLKEHACDFYAYSDCLHGYRMVVLRISDYGRHFGVTDAGVAPTCTEEGLTGVTRCSYCGIVMKEQEKLSALGHSLTLHEKIEPGCETEGAIAYYECKDCGEKFTDPDGLEILTEQITIPPAHIFNECVSNGDGTHTYICVRDASHTKTEDCRYEYEMLQEGTDSTPEKGKYTCTKCGDSFIAEKMIGEDSQVTLSADTFTYDGLQKKPSVTIRGLTQDVDYALSYESNVNAGTAFAIVTGIGNYTGRSVIEFTILPASLEKAEVTIEDQHYTGFSLSPVPEVKLDGKVLEIEKDYTVTYTDNVERGTASIKITGTGNYTGTCTAGFDILKRSIEDAEIVIPEQPYNGGDAVEPIPVITVAGNRLVAYRDFEVDYSDNYYPGTATAQISGVENYSGSLYVHFEITKASVAGARLGFSEECYTGEPVEPALWVMIGDRVINEGEDYSVTWKNNVNAGTASCTITGKGYYTGEKTGEFEILPASLECVYINISDQTYTGREIKPETEVITIYGESLQAGIDYDVSYRDNIETGTAYADIIGKGNYTGVETGYFEIVPASIENAEVTFIENEYTYEGVPVEPEPVVRWNGSVLKNNIDYALEWENNIDGGFGSVILTGQGNLTGGCRGEFRIRRNYGKAPSYTMVSDEGQVFTTTAQNGRSKVLVFYDDADKLNRLRLSMEGKTYAGVDIIFAYAGWYPEDEEKIKELYSRSLPGTFILSINSNMMGPFEEAAYGEKSEYTQCMTYLINAQNRIVSVQHSIPFDLDRLINEFLVNPDAPGPAPADTSFGTPEAVGLCGDNAVWRFYSDGTLRISGSGDLWDNVYSPTCIGWLNDNETAEDSYSRQNIYNKNVKTVIVDKEIGNVAGSMFSGFKNLRSVTFKGHAPDLERSAPEGWDEFKTQRDFFLGYGLFPVERTLSVIPVYYPEDDKTWTSSVKSFLGSLDGPIRWISLNQNGVHEHKWGSWKTTKAATVQAEGQKQRSCTECGKKQTKVIAKLPRISIEKAAVSGISDKIYTGSAIKPAPIVKVDGKTLKSGTDYSVTWSKNTAVGTATVKITGKENYTGTVTKNFKIKAASISKASVSGIKTKVWTGKALTQSPTLKFNGKVLVSGSDYTLSYKANKNVGTATLTITGKGNFNASIKKTYAINPKPTTISKLTAGTKKFTAAWKKQASQTTGYQIQYSTNKGFKSGNKTVTITKTGTLSSKITGLKGKIIYYVRIRTYKTINGKKYYSTWSTVKSVKTQ